MSLDVKEKKTLVKYTLHKIYHFNHFYLCSSVALSIFALVCKHPSPELFYPLQLKLCMYPFLQNFCYFNLSFKYFMSYMHLTSEDTYKRGGPNFMHSLLTWFRVFYCFVLFGWVGEEVFQNKQFIFLIIYEEV